VNRKCPSAEGSRGSGKVDVERTGDEEQQVENGDN